MGKSGRSANPTDTYRKQMKQKELKRNKEERKRLREVSLALKDTTKLEIDLSKYKKLEKDGKLDKNGKSKMTEIEAEIKKIHAVKKEHGIQIKSLPNPQDTPSSSFSQTSGRDPTKSIYYHPTLNPFGAPPPGAPYVEHVNENSLLNVDYSDGEEDGSNGSQPDDDNEESDPKNTQNTVIPPPPPSARPPPHVFQPFPPHMRPGMVVPPPPGQFYPGPPPPGRPPFPPMPPGFPYMAPQGPGALRRPPPPPPRNEYRSSPYKTSRPGRSEIDSANEVKKPAAPAVISAEPQIRNLQKELTKLVPAAVLRKKATGGVSSPAIPKVSLPKINAAPDMDYNVDTSARPTTNLSNLTASIFGKMGPVKPPNPTPSNASMSSSAPKPQKNSTNDEYEDFMKEMEGLL